MPQSAEGGRTPLPSSCCGHLGLHGFGKPFGPGGTRQSFARALVGQGLRGRLPTRSGDGSGRIGLPGPKHLRYRWGSHDGALGQGRRYAVLPSSSLFRPKSNLHSARRAWDHPRVHLPWIPGDDHVSGSDAAQVAKLDLLAGGNEHDGAVESCPGGHCHFRKTSGARTVRDLPDRTRRGAAWLSPPRPVSFPSVSVERLRVDSHPALAAGAPGLESMPA